jgi:hypothetical protein
MVGVDLYWSRLPPRPRSSAALSSTISDAALNQTADACAAMLKIAAALSFFSLACPCAGVVLHDLVLLLGAIAGPIVCYQESGADALLDLNALC